MQKNFTKQKILELLVNEINHSEKLKENVVRDWNARNRGKRRISDILKRKIPSNAIDVDELIWIYDILLMYSESLPDINSVFEEQELKNSSFNATAASSSDLIPILKSKGCEINTDRKAKYIHEELIQKEANENIIINTINRFTSAIADVENMAEKDLSEFDLNDFRELFSDVTVASFVAIKSFIVGYSEWCLERAYNSQSDLDLLKSLEVSDIIQGSSYKETYFASFEELEETLEAIKNNVDNVPYSGISEHITDNAVYLSAFLAWVGFNIKETVSIQKGDVDFENKTIKCPLTEKVIHDIPVEIMDYIKEQLNKIISANQKYLIYSEARDETSALRNNYLSQKLSIFNKCSPPQVKKKLNYKRIRESGNFRRMYDYEMSIGETLAVEHYEIVKELCRESKMNRNKCYTKMNEYRYWKKYLLS